MFNGGAWSQVESGLAGHAASDFGRMTISHWSVGWSDPALNRLETRSVLVFREFKNRVELKVKGQNLDPPAAKLQLLPTVADPNGRSKG